MNESKIKATRQHISALQSSVKQKSAYKAHILMDICLLFNIHKETIYKKIQMQQIRRPVMLAHPEERCLHNDQRDVGWQCRE